MRILKVFLVAISVIFVFASYGEVKVKCLIADTVGSAPIIDQVVFTFEQSTRGTVYDDGIIDIYWGDGSDERIQNSGLIFYSIKSKYISVSYEGHVNATILFNDKSKPDYWHRGSMLFRNGYYMLKCIEV